MSVKNTEKRKYYVYILLTEKNTLYTGITNNIERRISEHQKKQEKGARYTKAFGFCKLLYSEECPDRSMALKREWIIKKLSRKQKEELIIKKETGGLIR